MTDVQKLQTTLLGVLLFLFGGSLLGWESYKAAGRIEGMTAYIGGGMAFLGVFLIQPDAVLAALKAVGGFFPWAKRGTTSVSAVKDDKGAA